jgi:sterol 24-C-methyltransferase
MGYHHLDGFTDDTFDGTYTMETFAHATDPEVALAQLYRVLKHSSYTSMTISPPALCRMM